MYITEAHPSDVWQMQSNIKDKVVLASPKDEEERAVVAGACVRKLGIQIPAAIDAMGGMPFTRTGLSRLSVVPSPSSP